MNGLLDRIETLLDESTPTNAPELARLESTLTDGYAEALRLESDRIKIERRIDQVVVSETTTEMKAEELNSLILRLSRTREDIDRLRALLDVLKHRASAARTEGAGPERRTLSTRVDLSVQSVRDQRGDD